MAQRGGTVFGVDDDELLAARLPGLRVRRLADLPSSDVYALVPVRGARLLERVRSSMGRRALACHSWPRVASRASTEGRSTCAEIWRRWWRSSTRCSPAASTRSRSFTIPAEPRSPCAPRPSFTCARTTQATELPRAFDARAVWSHEPAEEPAKTSDESPHQSDDPKQQAADRLKQSAEQAHYLPAFLAAPRLRRIVPRTRAALPLALYDLRPVSFPKASRMRPATPSTAPVNRSRLALLAITGVLPGSGDRYSRLRRHTITRVILGRAA
jgi:hypothetical protein